MQPFTRLVSTLLLFTAFTSAPAQVVWTARTSGITDRLSSGAYGGTGSVRWVVVGGNPTSGVQPTSVVLTSSDGITWTTRVSGTANPTLTSVCWAGTQWVAVGYNGSIRTSPDGITWTSRSSGATGTLYGVVWTGSQVVAVGLGYTVSNDTYYGAILTSPDGINWTSRTSGVSGIGSTPALRSVAWTGTQLVASGGANVVTSPDGVTWTVRTPGGVFLDTYSVIWTRDQLVMTGASGAIRTSNDGANWTYRNTAGTIGTAFSMVKTVDLIVLAGSGGVIFTSVDAITWTSRASGTGVDLYGAAWNGASAPWVVVVGAGGTILTSSMPDVGLRNAGFDFRFFQPSVPMFDLRGRSLPMQKEGIKMPLGSGLFILRN